MLANSSGSHIIKCGMVKRWNFSLEPEMVISPVDDDGWSLVTLKCNVFYIRHNIPFSYQPTLCVFSLWCILEKSYWVKDYIQDNAMLFTPPLMVVAVFLDTRNPTDPCARWALLSKIILQFSHKNQRYLVLTWELGGGEKDRNLTYASTQLYAVVKM